MANKFAKEFSEGANHNFGSFTPKDVPKNDTEGAKESSGSSGGNNNTNSNNVIQKQAENAAQAAIDKTPQGKAINAGIAAQNKVNQVSPTQNAKSGIKADLEASVTGEDHAQIEARQREQENNPVNAGAKALKGKAAKSAAVKGGKVALGKAASNSVGAAVGSKMTGALGALKGAATNALGAIKGFFVSVGSAATKAGAAVGAFLHTSAAVGTAIVVSGTVAVTSIPVAGGAGYFINQHTQRTDGCLPEEYDEPSASGGELIALTAERLAWPEGTPKEKYDYDMGGTPTDAAAQAADKWYPVLKNGSYNGRSGGYWKMACCCHSANVIVREACQTDKIGNLLPNTSSPDAARAELEQSLKDQDFDIFPYDGKESSLKRGDVLCYGKKSGGGHVWIYLGDGKSADGGRTSNVFSHISGSYNRDANLGNYNYYFVMRKRGGGGVSVLSKQTGVATSTVTARKDIQAVIDWARMIAKDPSYHYGKGHGNWFDCDYCKHRNAKSKAYTCMPFVAAAYAHGTNDPVLFNNGKHRMYLTDQNYTGEFANVWGKVGWCKDLKFSDLEPGDVIIRWSSDNSNGHAWLYGGGDIILESTHNYGPRETTGAQKRFEKYANGAGNTPSKNYVMRYIGDGSPLFGSSDYNDLVADMTADDGCGGEMDGAKEGDTYIGKGMKEVTAANGEKYIILDFDLEQVKKLGKQGTAQCYQYSIGYCDLILGGKFRCTASSAAFKTAYGDGDVNGVPGKIGGVNKNLGSTDDVVKTCIDEIKQGRPVIIHVAGNSYNVETGGHFVCVCGWTANAGASPSWDELVCCDPAYFYGSNNDGLHAIKGFHDYKNTHNVTTFEGWTPASGQTKRQN